MAHLTEVLATCGLAEATVQAPWQQDRRGLSRGWWRRDSWATPRDTARADGGRCRSCMATEGSAATSTRFPVPHVHALARLKVKPPVLGLQAPPTH